MLYFVLNIKYIQKDCSISRIILTHDIPFQSNKVVKKRQTYPTLVISTTAVFSLPQTI